MPASSDEGYFCTHCGKKGYPVLVPRGHVFVEVVLWICYIVPGLIYSIWRRVRTKEVCPECAHPSMISSHSAKARQLMALVNIDQRSLRKAKPRIPAGAAKSREKKYLTKRNKPTL